MKFHLTALALGLLATPALAQDDTRLKELERKVEILSKELEAQKTGSSLPEAAESGAAKVYASKGGLSIGGYGEFLYQAKEGRLQDGTPGVGEKSIDALRLVLYTGYKFNQTIVFNSEIEFEHGGYSDEHPEGEAVVEFAYLDFLLNPAFNIRAGQMLVPMGFINEQHEPPAFLGARRPQVERSILPATWHENGIGVHGELPGHFNYRIYLMNGLRGDKFTAEGIRDGRQAGKEANAQSLAWTGRLDWNPAPGTTLGLSFYSGNSNQTGQGEALRTTLVDAHGEWRWRGLQVRGLYAQTRIAEGGVAAFGISDPAREVGTYQWGGYLEAGYDVLQGSRQALIPYVRYERLNTQAQVIQGISPNRGNDQKALTVGLAYKPIPNAVAKVDYQKLENAARTGQNQFNVAMGFYF
ncbi:MAG: hypothetical protein WAT51_03525 [Holophaga sp.]